MEIQNLKKKNLKLFENNRDASLSIRMANV